MLVYPPGLRLRFSTFPSMPFLTLIVVKKRIFLVHWLIYIDSTLYLLMVLVLISSIDNFLPFLRSLGTGEMSVNSFY